MSSYENSLPMNDPRTLRSIDALHPFQGGQIQPLVVLRVDVGVGQECGSLHVPRLVEYEQALVAVARHLQHLEAHLTDALATVPIAQHHLQSSGEIPEAVVAGARFARESQALFLRWFVLGKRGCVREAGARERQSEDTERGAPGAWESLRPTSADRRSLDGFALRGHAHRSRDEDAARGRLRKAEAHPFMVLSGAVSLQRRPQTDAPDSPRSRSGTGEFRRCKDADSDQLDGLLAGHGLTSSSKGRPRSPRAAPR